MAQIQEIERTGTTAVKRLHIRKPRNGHSFMINSKDLPGKQCYLEHPNGTIVLATIKKSARNLRLCEHLL
jgi:hypothetical protein